MILNFKFIIEFDLTTWVLGVGLGRNGVFIGIGPVVFGVEPIV